MRLFRSLLAVSVFAMLAPSAGHSLTDCSPYQCYDSVSRPGQTQVWCGDDYISCEIDICDPAPGTNMSCCSVRFACCPNGRGGHGQEAWTEACAPRN